MKRKLTPEQVREILRRVVNGRLPGKRGSPDSQSALALEFNVPQSSISRIASREYHRRVKP